MKPYETPFTGTLAAVKSDDERWVIQGAEKNDPMLAISVGGQDEAHAQELVKRWNEYEVLLAALKRISSRGLSRRVTRWNIVDATAAANEALRKIKKGA